MAYAPSAKLAKFLAYILGRRPDEFGLIPDADGYVKIKDLLKAFSEEEGWRHVRQTLIKEVMLTSPEPVIEISDKLIRAAEREELPKIFSPESLPKLLYTCVRQKAHAFVLNNGISPLGGMEYVVMSSEEDMAMRLGKRFDENPLLISVQTDWAEEQGVLIQQFGEKLFLARYIPADAFIAPPLPKEREEVKKKAPLKKPEKPKTPGSFFLEFGDLDDKKKSRRDQRKKDKMRDKAKRQGRREKQRGWGK